MKKIKPKYKIGQTVLFTPYSESVQEKFLIKDIKQQILEDENGVKRPCFMYYNDSGFLDEDDIDGLARDSIKITNKTLKEDGWKYYSEFKGLITGYKKDITYNDKQFYCDIKYGSNTNGRNWSVHIDNDVCDTVGTMDISNFGQLDRFLELLSE